MPPDTWEASRWTGFQMEATRAETWVMQMQAAPVPLPGTGRGGAAPVGGECWRRPGGPREGCCWRRVQCMNSCIVESGTGVQRENVFIL